MLKTLKNWQSQRDGELSSTDSWLGLVGLFWLQRGANRVGSAADATVVLPAGPEFLGDLRWEDDVVLWQPADGVGQEMQTDLRGPPSIVNFENLSLFVVDRDGQLAVRIRDRNWAAKTPFAGLDYFAFEPAWQIVAEWQAIDPPLSMEVPNVSGDLKAVSVAHRAVFEHAGQSVSLLPMSVSDDGVFFVFRDRTSGKETYGAGRFLKVPTAVDGRITIDFNRAYNPPCAFTPFATCPLPPPENWLPFAVPAGEKKWEKG
jgi:uncharacterized protein (DUF1684 family)